MRSRAMTLVEVTVTIAILVFVLLGFLRLFIHCSDLAQMSRNLTMAMSNAQGTLEAMRYYNFDRLVIDYGLGGVPGNTFVLSQLDGSGVIYIDSTNPEALIVRIAVSYRSAANHFVGEDRDFDGIPAGAEDVNGNGVIDSPASLVSIITKR